MKKNIEIDLKNLDEMPIPKEFYKSADEELCISIKYEDYSRYSVCLNFGKEYGTKVTLDDICDTAYDKMIECLHPSNEIDICDDACIDITPILRKFLLVANHKEKIDLFDKAVEKQIDFECFPSELEWVANLCKIQLSGKLLEEFPEDERDLYYKHRR